MQTHSEVITNSAVRTRNALTCSADNQVPTRIEVMKAGVWPATSAKGQLTISIADLQEFKSNFDAGIGIPQGLNQLPIDYMHEDWAKAAGWMTALEVVADTLYADVTWTPQAEQMLRDGEFKLFSPSFWPACLGEWHDPEDYSKTARNVLVGAGLTNIPFFKNLKPIMSDNKQQILFLASEAKGETMTLEELRNKTNDELTDEQRDFIATNEEHLTDEEKIKFGFKEAPKTDPEVNAEEKKEESNGGTEVTQVTEVPAEVAQIAASLKSGEVVAVKASEWKNTQDTIAEFRRKEEAAFVTAHVARGAIKADKQAEWTDRLVNASAEDRETYRQILADMQSNPMLASTQGSTEGGDVTAASVEIKEKAEKLMASAKAEGAPIDIGTAMSRVMAADKALTDRYNLELQGKE